MGMFEWKDKYATGIHQIDEQHKGLIELINKNGCFFLGSYYPKAPVFSVHPAPVSSVAV